MINETNGLTSAKYGNATHNIITLCPVVNISKRLTIHNAVVLYLQPVDIINLLYYAEPHLVNTHHLSPCEALMQRLINVTSYLAFFRGKQRVATAHCQSAFLSNDRTGNDLNLKAIISNHTSNNGYLLKILLTKIGTIWFNHHKQLAHNLANTIEMTWTEGTFHHTVSGWIAKVSRIRFWIDLTNRRGKSNCRAT